VVERVAAFEENGGDQVEKEYRIKGLVRPQVRRLLTGHAMVRKLRARRRDLHAGTHRRRAERKGGEKANKDGEYRFRVEPAQSGPGKSVGPRSMMRRAQQIPCA
jgi:hypothetical protein